MKSLLHKSLTKVLYKVFLIAGITFLMLGCSSLVEENKKADYRIEMVSSINDIKSNQQIKLIYKIKDKQGNTLKDFEVMNEKIMHFIIIRKDLQYFQHIHPEFDKTTGEFSISVIFVADGEYRMFTDFMPSMEPGSEHLPIAVYKDVVVGNLADYKPEPLGNIIYIKKFNDYSITVTPSSKSLLSKKDLDFTFEIKKGDQPVTNLEKYLGALGHTVVIREGNLQFIHAHAIQSPDIPQTGKVTFMIRFPKAGNYKLFSQFQHEGKVITSDFLVNVAKDMKNSSDVMMKHKGMK